MAVTQGKLDGATALLRMQGQAGVAVLAHASPGTLMAKGRDRKDKVHAPLIFFSSFCHSKIALAGVN